MAYTQNFKVPPEEELNTTEINISMAALYAGAFQIGKACEKPNNEFMLCKKEEGDPRKCLKEGKEVTQCTLEVLQHIKKHCLQEFNNFAHCLYKSSASFEYSKCRKTQKAFNECALKKIGLDVPPWGWNAEIKVHKTDRPLPEEKPQVFYEVPDKLDPATIQKKPKFGDRLSI